jgi:hypothetical protein
MRPVIQTRALVAAAVGAVCASQTTAGAGNLLINGSLASGGVATMAAQQVLGITSAGNDSAVNFTITGTDDQGRVISQTIAGPNANTVQTTLNYRTVTSIAVSAAVASAVTVDTLQIGASTEVPLDQYITAFNVSIAVDVTGTINYTVQYTFDDVFGSGAPGPFVWRNFTTLTAQAVSGNGTLISPVKAVRILTNSGAGTAKMTVVQSGLT